MFIQRARHSRIGDGPPLWRRLLLVLAVFALIASACGDDDDAGDDITSNDADSAPADDGAGDDGTSSDADTASDDAASDDDDAMSDDATSDDGTDEAAGRFAPQPLAEPTTIKMNVPIRLDSFLHFLLAQEMGEFEKENLTVEFEALPSRDALPLLAAGDLDAIVTSWNASIVNAVASGVEMKAVLEVGEDPPPGTGVWVLNSSYEKGPGDLEGKNIGSAIGPGSLGSLAMENYLAEAGLDITAIQWETFPASEIPLAMQNGAVDAAYVTSPGYLQIQDIATFVGNAADGFSGGMIVFGPSLLDGDPAVGDAFVRAVMRTMDTYLQGDYKADPEILPLVAAALQTEEDVVTGTSSFVFDPERPINGDVIDQLQAVWLKEPDVMTVDEPIPSADLLDLSFQDRVLAAG